MQFVFMALLVLQGEQNPSIAEAQKDVIARLTGKKEIRPGVLITDRFQESNRRAARRFLLARLKGHGIESQTHRYSESGANIYGILKSTVPSDEYVVLGAHFDSVKNCPGANDNATGVALVCVIARDLSRLRPRSKNFIFVFFDEEEKGLIGSSHFAKKLLTEKLRIHSVHTIDQMGWDRDEDRAIELELPTKELTDLYRRTAKKAGMRMPIHLSRVASSDHTSFRKQGFAAVGITEEYVNGDTTPHYHRRSDTRDTVLFEYLEHTTRFLLLVMKELLQE